MTPFERLKERYMHDARFRTCVDLLHRNFLDDAIVSPDELRDACTLALTIHYERCVTPMIVIKRDGGV